MDLVLLPGNSSNNKEWIERVDEKLSKHFASTVIDFYGHWETGGDFIDFFSEAQKVKEMINNMNEYIVFAKSIGTILTFRMLREHSLEPKGLLLCGVPLQQLKNLRGDLFDYLEAHPEVLCTIIQQDQDKVGRYDELVSILGDLASKRIRTISIPGNDHSYDNLDLIVKEMKRIVGKK